MSRDVSGEDVPPAPAIGCKWTAPSDLTYPESFEAPRNLGYPSLVGTEGIYLSESAGSSSGVPSLPMGVEPTTSSRQNNPSLVEEYNALLGLYSQGTMQEAGDYPMGEAPSQLLPVLPQVLPPELHQPVSSTRPRILQRLQHQPWSRDRMRNQPLGQPTGIQPQQLW
jgi:hypothetical protein